MIAPSARNSSDLFIGLGRGELLPYGLLLSHRLPARAFAGAAARGSSIGRSRAPRRGGAGRSRRYLCEIMSGLASRRLPAPPDRFRSPDLRQTWRPGSDVSSAIWNRPRPDFYRRLGTLGRVFMEMEAEAFELPRGGSRRTSINFEEGTAMKQHGQVRRRASPLPARDGRRRGSGVTAQRRIAAGRRVRRGEKEGPLQGDRSREGLLPRQPLSGLPRIENKEAAPC